MKFTEIQGNLIELALKGEFEVITHGCNCFSTMGAGIAPQMAKEFGCNKFEMELIGPSIKKLGNIDYEIFNLKDNKELVVINSYTQFHFGQKNDPPLDYEALKLCLRKINNTFSGKKIGLPLIGCGLAGGNWNIVKKIIIDELKDMDVYVVHYNK